MDGVPALAASETSQSLYEAQAQDRVLKHPTLFKLRAGQCRFPLGERNEVARFFCGKPALSPKPYCTECCQRAYVTIRAR
jgi:hypothetical protein